MAREEKRSEPARHRAVRSFLRAQVREQQRIMAIRPIAPSALRARVGRWFAATFVRELAWQLSLLDGLALGALAALGGFRRRLGRALGVALGLTLLVHLRHAITAHRSAATVEAALEGLPGSSGRQIPLREIAFPPLMFRDPHVRHERGVVYKEIEGKRLRLDIYRPAQASAGARPALIQIHGGGWFSGSRHEQGIPLLNHMVALGWVGFNIDYRLSPQATWPDHIVDVKSAIAWVRENASGLGIDPDRIAITGGSAGSHLTALAGLTENAPEFQPGFEDADTSVLAAIPFYGVYDLTNASGHYYPEISEWTFEKVVFKRTLAGHRDLYEQASPLFRIHPEAPPFMVIHGERDTLVPVADAREFAAAMKRISDSDVRYIELAEAEHAFDLWPSVRTARVVDAVGRFLTAAEQQRSTAAAPLAGSRAAG